MKGKSQNDNNNDDKKEQPVRKQSSNKCQQNGTDQEDTLKKDVAQCLSQLRHCTDVPTNLSTLQHLLQLISTSTGFSSIPQTLKILMSDYDTFKEFYNSTKNLDLKRLLADIISFIATSHPPNSKGDVLRYFLNGSRQKIDVFGIAYVRELCKDIVHQWRCKSRCDTSDQEILANLIIECSQYFMRQNSEIETCDLLIETEKISSLLELVDHEEICDKVCNYINTCAPYLPESESKSALYCAVNLRLKYNHYIDALLLAITLQSVSIIEKLFRVCSDELIQKQMAFILARHNITIDEKDLKPEVNALLRNSLQSQHFLHVARQLDIMAPKAPSDILKSKNKYIRSNDTSITLVGSSLLNGFLNAGFCSDKLLLDDQQGMAWIGKHKDYDKFTATASIGLLCLWDVDRGLNKIDKYLYTDDVFLKGGALLACGMVSCTVRSEFDPAYLLLGDYVCHENETLRLGAIIGLGLAYVGNNHSNVSQVILRYLKHDNINKHNNNIIGIGAISCGLIGHSSANGSLISSLVEILVDQSSDLRSNSTRNIVHGIGLCIMGKVDILPTLNEAIQLVPSEPIKQYFKMFIDICAYVGSSNILKIQELIEICATIERKQTKRQSSKNKKIANQSNQLNQSASKKTVADDEENENDNLLKMLAVLGIAMLSIGDELNRQMVMRTFDNFLRNGDVFMKRAAILAISLLNLSNAKLSVVDLLSKYSHSSDNGVVLNSILALGLVGAGTNNTRVAKLLNDLTEYYHARACYLLNIKISQGLLHLGKGTLTLCPLMEGRSIRQCSVGGVLVMLLQLMNDELSLLHKPYYVFYLASAIRPKMLLTLDSQLNPIQVPVRVGQLVDTIGQAGKPRGVTGFQTFNTPVLLGTDDNAELATEQYKPLNPCLQGCVLVSPKVTPLNNNT